MYSLSTNCSIQIPSASNALNAPNPVVIPAVVTMKRVPVNVSISFDIPFVIANTHAKSRFFMVSKYLLTRSQSELAGSSRIDIAYVFCNC